MPDIYYSSFSIAPMHSVRDEKFNEAIKIYTLNTPREIETDEQEIIKFIKTKSDTTKREMHYFALCYNDKTIGYCQVAHLKHTKVLFIDYFTLQREYKTNITFFPLFNLVLDYFNENLDYSYFIVETGYQENGQSIDEDSKFLNDFLPLVGFNIIDFPYTQPRLGDNLESEISSRLLVKSKVGKTSLSTTTLNNIIDDLLINHYLDWYNIIYKDDPSKKDDYKKKIYSLKSSLLKDLGNNISMIPPRCSNCLYLEKEQVIFKSQKKLKRKLRKIISLCTFIFGLGVLIAGVIIFVKQNKMEDFYYMFSPLIAFFACGLSYVIKDL